MILQASAWRQLLVFADRERPSEFDAIYSCGNSTKYCYLDCYEIGKALITIKEGCGFDIAGMDISKKGNHSLLLNKASMDAWMNKNRSFPGCVNSRNNEGIRRNIREAIHPVSYTHLTLPTKA